MRSNTVLGFLFMSANAGDSELAFGVVLRASNTKHGSAEQRLTFLNVFFALRIIRTRCHVSEVVYFSKFTKLPRCIL